MIPIASPMISAMVAPTRASESGTEVVPPLAVRVGCTLAPDVVELDVYELEKFEL